MIRWFKVVNVSFLVAECIVLPTITMWDHTLIRYVSAVGITGACMWLSFSAGVLSERFRDIEKDRE